MSVLELTPQLVEKATADLQIVVIDSFYDARDQAYALEWLGKLFRFKVNSYLESYPYGILPFGGSDLVGTHWILCRKLRDDLIPIMGIKMTDSNRTDIFRMEFPALELVSGPNLVAHRNAIEHELMKSRNAGKPLGYVGSWVVAPEVREDIFLSKLCRKLSSALISRWIVEYNIQTAIAFASLTFHVEKFHAYLGVTRLTGPNGEYLSDFKMYSAFDEPICTSVFYRANHSRAALQDMIDTQKLWNERIMITHEGSPLFQNKPEKRSA